MLIDPLLSGPERLEAAAALLIDATVEMAQSGKPLMRRVLPDDPTRVWSHYPPDDAVDRLTGARWFYHAHPLEERGDGEHGHFHLFLDRADFADAESAIAGPLGDSGGASVVHIAALSVDLAGLPRALFAVNRWVTDEWLYPAADILARLRRFDLGNAGDGDPIVNRWLTAVVAAFEPELRAVLQERDRAIAGKGPDWFEDRSAEVLSSIAIDLQDGVTRFGRVPNAVPSAP